MSSNTTSPLSFSSPVFKKSNSMDLDIINISQSTTPPQNPINDEFQIEEIMNHEVNMEDLKLGETLLLNLMHSRDKVPILASSGSNIKLSSSSSSIPIRREPSSHHHTVPHHPYVSKSLPSSIDLGIDNNNSLAKLKNRLNSSTNSLHSISSSSLMNVGGARAGSPTSQFNVLSRSSSPVGSPPSSSTTTNCSSSPISPSSSNSTSSSFINNILLIDEEDSIESPDSDYYECSRPSPPNQCIEEIGLYSTNDTIHNYKSKSNVHDLLVPNIKSPNNSPSKNNRKLLTSSSPIPSSSSSSPTLAHGRCTFDEPCLLCRRGTPILLTKTATWASIMKVVFFTLADSLPLKTYYSLKSDIYGFMDHHWDILSLNKKKSTNWHKQIQDMLSHSKMIFESGVEVLGQNGFWRLKQLSDPWLEGVISGYGNNNNNNHTNNNIPTTQQIQYQQTPNQFHNLRISSSKVPSLSQVRPILPAN